MEPKKISIIIPSFNEAQSLKLILPQLTAAYPYAQIIIVNDGSTDNTIEVCQAYNVEIISHPYNKGNGAAVKTGVRHATNDIIVLMDADGQHQVSEIAKLLQTLNANYDLVVGSRSNKGQASVFRLIANKIYNGFASLMVGQKVLDLTSGFRAARTEKFREFLHLLPNGFSYPSTSTMAFFRAGYNVGYVPVEVLARTGKSHIKPLKDGIRFLLIIYKIATLYSPLKVFFPLAIAHFLLGVSNYVYTFITYGSFTNMSVVLLSTAIIIFLIGLVSEQITVLMYQKRVSSHENSH